MDYIDDIKKHFEEEYPREGCGILSVKKVKKVWTPCKNLAEDEEDFVIDSTEFLRVKRTSDIIAIVHSHPDASPEPSEGDIKYCNTLGIPYYIFSYPEMDLHVLEPKVNTTELYGREYEFGVRDCFEASRDYLKTKGINIPLRMPFEDDWWEKGLDYFNDELISEWNHFPIPIPEIQANDILIFRVLAERNNHCGVYIGNDHFYHHANERLSCRESLYPLWHKYLVGAYRYDA